MIPLMTSDPTQTQIGKRERELLYKALFDMKRELRGLKGVVTDLVRNHGNIKDTESAFQQLNLEGDKLPPQDHFLSVPVSKTFDAQPTQENEEDYHDSHEVVEESLSLAEREKEFIIKALDNTEGKEKMQPKN